jgi:hypothetical protein
MVPIDFLVKLIRRIFPAYPPVMVAPPLAIVELAVPRIKRIAIPAMAKSSEA